jgi:hypothetical protein
MRGLDAYLKKISSDYDVVGYTETSISMAGWGVAYLAPQYGMKAVIFDPQYKNPPAGPEDPLTVLAAHRKKWAKFNAEVVPLAAGMARVNWNVSNRIMLKNYHHRFLLLPLGLPLPETIEETRREYDRTIHSLGYSPATVVVCVGSGTIAAGLLRAIKPETYLIGVMCRKGHIYKKRKMIYDKSGRADGGLLGTGLLELFNPGYEYTELPRDRTPAPFPCNPWYDLKAWEWLVKNVHLLKPPILFWNIGGAPCLK